MKFIIGKEYNINFENGAKETVKYIGFEKDYNCFCDCCDKEIFNAHLFVAKKGYAYHYGSECVKKINIK